ncbi:MAG: hypothetical protein IJA17_04855 [Oscillospiraceae bacterium]|nr:hypothetical protein [Oscillospiraceae bacterium]
MKRIFAFLIVFVLLFSGCSEEESPVSSAPEKSESSSEQSPESSSLPEESVEINFDHLPKGVAGSCYNVLDEIIPSEGEFGTEEDLERWKTEVNDTENISEIVVYSFSECEERYLSQEEIYGLLSEIQNNFPVIYEEPENPATGGSYTVAAYGPDGEIKWIMSWGGFFTVYYPGNEKALYFNGDDLYFSSLVSICDYRSPLN